MACGFVGPGRFLGVTFIGWKRLNCAAISSSPPKTCGSFTRLKGTSWWNSWLGMKCWVCLWTWLECVSSCRSVPFQSCTPRASRHEASQRPWFQSTRCRSWLSKCFFLGLRGTCTVGCRRCTFLFRARCFSNLSMGTCVSWRTRSRRWWRFLRSWRC